MKGTFVDFKISLTFSRWFLTWRGKRPRPPAISLAFAVSVPVETLDGTLFCGWLGFPVFKHHDH